MPALRHQRVRELLKREIGEILRREMPLDQAGKLSVNEVGVSNDLHSATVYVGVVGSADQRKRAGTLLRKNRKRFQGMLGRAVVLRYTPQLQFIVDDAVERGNRVLSIMEELEPPEESEPPESPC